MKSLQALFAIVCGVGIGACAAHDAEPSYYGLEQGLAGDRAAGSIPKGLPSRVMVGLFEDSGATWMKSSGVPWDSRYRYFTKGWVNNWGWSPADGSWGLAYMRECDSQ